MWTDIAIGVLIFAALVLIGAWGALGERPRLPKWLGGEDDDAAAAAPPPPPPAAQKTEPTFGKKGAALDLYTPPPLPEVGEEWQGSHCYAARFDDSAPGSAERIEKLQEALRPYCRVYHILGYDDQAKQWSAACAATPRSYWTALIPLASRSGGALSATRLRQIEDQCQQFATRHGLHAVLPKRSEAAERAQQTDEFCRQMDIVLRLNVAFERPLPIADVRELLRHAYLSPDDRAPDGAERYVYRLDSEALFSATLQPAEGGAEHTRQAQFMLDVPRVSRPQRAYDDMLERMEGIAELKNGKILHRHARQLTAQDADLLRATIDQTAKHLTARGIPPGSPLANLLFGD